MLRREAKSWLVLAGAVSCLSACSTTDNSCLMYEEYPVKVQRCVSIPAQGTICYPEWTTQKECVVKSF